ncbi:SRPBCC domain-containing protein [Sphingomonas sp.]|uniref:SRPBCC domain-containing protein n=1 Tax=Sphingomonas sp. TaxID=28214 RepID=UPI0028B1E9BC|nr:SRPBCC domain-containing protein [Sphingomonas sp.]
MGLSMHDAATSRTKVERTSDVDMVVQRSFDAPAHLVFRAWSDAELFRRWWVPASAPVRLRTCEMEVRTGGSYRLEFGEDEGPVHAFFGRYVEVVPNEKIVWTNEESDDGALTTVTFEETDGKTLVTYHDRHGSKESLDEAFEGMEGGIAEQFEQLAAVLAE